MSIRGPYAGGATVGVAAPASVVPAGSGLAVTAPQLAAHMCGDYLFQSHAMALGKGRSSRWALAHAVTYGVAFLPVTRDPVALAGVVGAHFVVDRWRLARFVVWAKNGARGPVTATGYPAGTPDGLALGLFVVADNTIHVLLNALVLGLTGRRGHGGRTR